MNEPKERRLLVTLTHEGEARPEPQPDWKEYYHIQTIVSGYNADCLEIKKWSVTTASIIAVVGQAGLKNLSLVLIVVMAAAIVFWLTETIWRMNQWAFVRRIQEIELEQDAPQISTKWDVFYRGRAMRLGSWRKPDVNGDNIVGERSFRGFIDNFFAPVTYLPHAVIFLMAFAAWYGNHHWHFEKPEQVKPQVITGELDVRLRADTSPPKAGRTP